LQKKLDADFVELSMTLLEGQWDFDYLHQDVLLPAEIKDARLHIADEAYRVLILPPMDMEDAAVVQKAAEFADQGGWVISVGQLPGHSSDGDDQKMKDAVGKLIVSHNKRFHMADDFQQMLSVLKGSLPPDFLVVPEAKHLLALHRQKDGKDAFFAFNNSDQAWTGKISVMARGKAEIWDPIDGSISPAEAEEKGGRSLISLSLEGYAGSLVVFEAEDR
jgi:hypothetical protein